MPSDTQPPEDQPLEIQWYKGKAIEAVAADSNQAPLNDIGLRFGASVFTTLRVYDNCLEDPRSQYAAHCDRLRRSIHTFDWQPPSWQSIYQGCNQLTAYHPILRITLFPDGTEWITSRPLPPQLSQSQDQGIACWVAPPTYARSLPTHKTGNYLACYLARQQAHKLGAQEAILTNLHGDWLETATGNLWGWGQGQWWTPVSSAPGSQCLPGIMRHRLRALLTSELTAGRQVVGDRPWDSSLLSTFEAIAYSNCVVELVPIHTIFNQHTKLEYDPHHTSLQALRKKLRSQTQFCDDS